MQLALFPPPSRAVNDPGPGAVLPKSSGIRIPFEWTPIEEILEASSVDFPDEGLYYEENQDRKRNDPGYAELLHDIMQKGILDPVFFGAYYDDPEFLGEYAEYDDVPARELGNGHHRVVACLDLGYTHVPTTDDHTFQWRESGITTDRGK